MPDLSSILLGEAVTLERATIGLWDGDGTYSSIYDVYGAVRMVLNGTSISAERRGDGGAQLARYTRVTGGNIELEFSGDLTSIATMFGLTITTTGVTPNRVRKLEFKNVTTPNIGFVGSLSTDGGEKDAVHVFAPKCQVTADSFTILEAQGGSEANYGTMTVTLEILLDVNQLSGESTAVQNIDLDTATAGTYTLSFGSDVTSALAYNADAAAVQAALRLLPNIGTDGVTVATAAGTGDFDVTFAGRLENKKVPLLVIDATSLTNSGGEEVTELTAGSTGDYVWAVLAEVEGGLSTTLPPTWL